jgi:hypothetical protein
MTSAERGQPERPDPAQPPVGPPAAKGRVARGWRLLRKSWGFLKEDPRLLVLPGISAVLVTAAGVAIAVPTLHATRDLDWKFTMLILTAAWSLPFTLVSTYLNVGFLAMVQARIRGEDPTVRQGLEAARSRLPQIVAWSLLATAVGLVLRGLEQLPGGDWIGRLLGVLGGLAWSLATFFVVPILALEGTGPIESVRRSAATFRRRWGETLTGDISISAIFGLVAIPGMSLLVAGITVFDEGSVSTGVWLVAVGIVLLIPPLMFSTALAQMFQMLLYREAVEGEVEGPFTASDLRDALRSKRKRFWQR